MTAHMSSGREEYQRNPQPKSEQWALADSIIIYKPGGRRSSSTTGYQIPPCGARYALSTGTQQGGDWTRTTPAISSEPGRLAGALGIASQAMAILSLARPMWSQVTRHGLPVHSLQRPLPRLVTHRRRAATHCCPRCDLCRPAVPKSSSGFSSARATRDLRDRGRPGLCDLVRPVVAHRVQAGRPIVVSEYSGGSPCLPKQRGSRRGSYCLVAVLAGADASGPGPGP